MKKKLFSLTAATVVIFTIAASTYKNSNKVELSDLTLSNVEALASGESGTKRYQTMGYCTPSRMDYMCTSTYTAESCRRPC